jgi:hypothetical protein
VENETGEVSRKMNDVLARAACDFEDDTRRRQDIAKDIENEIAITYCRRRVLAVIRHLSRTFDMASAWLTQRASASSARSSDVFIAEVSHDSARGILSREECSASANEIESEGVISRYVDVS